MKRAFTGWHMSAIFVGFFGVVLGVNVLMASLAISTFGGIQVENSYVASQKFNRWLDAAQRSKALGWQAEATMLADGRVRVTASGPGEAATLLVHARHPLGREADRTLTFTRGTDGVFTSIEVLPQEPWILRLELSEGEAHWRREVRV